MKIEMLNHANLKCCICEEGFDRDDLEIVDDGSGDLICVECMHPEGEAYEQGA